ncbi:hypothetical protein LTR28_007350, partial [Elasticomyces elasticus]
MAAYGHRAGSANRQPSLPGSQQSTKSLPDGCCNFRDLSIGTTALSCGCRRFWPEKSLRDGGQRGQDTAWCYCGHHACYHDFVKSWFSPSLPIPVDPRPSFPQDASVVAPPAHDGNTVQKELEEADGRRRTNDQSSQPSYVRYGQDEQTSGLGLRLDSRLADTKVWHALNAFAREQADNAQFLTPGQRLLYPHSTLPSTAAPSVVGIQRASPSRVLMDNALRGHRFRPPINILPTQQTAQAPEDIIASATEVATPSNAGTPDLCAFGKTIQDAIAWTQDSQFHRQPSPAALLRSPPRFDQLRSQEGPSNASARKLNGQDGAAESVSMAQIRSILEQLLPYLGQIHDHLKANTNAQDVVRSLSRRLETLETASFSHIPVEEIQEKFELFDGRLLDIEGWKEEQEKRPAAETYTTQEPRHRRRLPSETDSFASNASCGSARSVSRGSAQADQQLAVAVARLDNMKEQLDDLETHASPSFRSPWTVEVIFLPWGRDMKGIWVSADNEPPHQMKPSTQALEEWTQTQVSTSASAPLISNTGT